MKRVIGVGVGLAILLVIAVLATRDLSLLDRLTHRIGPPAVTYAAPSLDGEDPPLVRLAVAGDVGTGDARERATAAAMSKRAAVAPFSGLLLLGDNVYPDGDPDHLDETVFGPFAPVLRPGTKLLPVLGNHDVRDGHGPAQLARLGRASSWYAETLGPVQVIALDSTRPDDPAQRAWLADVLKTPAPAWRVAIMHSPMYSAGMHGGVRSVRRAFEDVLVTGGVDLVLAGHDHDYQRSQPIRGMVHIVSGGAARLRRTGREEFTAYSASTRHFLEISAWSDRLRATAIDQDGRAFDDVFLRPSGE